MLIKLFYGCILLFTVFYAMPAAGVQVLSKIFGVSLPVTLSTVLLLSLYHVVFNQFANWYLMLFSWLAGITGEIDDNPEDDEYEYR